jgi:hypothetical protein
MNEQLDWIRNREPTPADWMAAAEAARRNPYEAPDAAERRARYYEEQAKAANRERTA